MSQPLTLIERVSMPRRLDRAFDHVKKARIDSAPSNGIWDISRHWPDVREKLTEDLQNGTFHFAPQKEYIIDGKSIIVWEALDAIVLRALKDLLTPLLKPHLSEHCMHCAGKGLNKAVRETHQQLDKHAFYFRTDVQGYYAAMDHDITMDRFEQHIDDPLILRLLRLSMERLVDRDAGYYEQIHRGISLRCSLSPLMAALYLKPLDDAMARKNIFYTRFMDDWVILAQTRQPLRRAIKTVHQIMAELKLKLHPDKTEVGRLRPARVDALHQSLRQHGTLSDHSAPSEASSMTILPSDSQRPAIEVSDGSQPSKGFDFLGHHFEAGKGLSVAGYSIRRFCVTAVRLDEQGASLERLLMYLTRWRRWATEKVLSCSGLSTFQSTYLGFLVMRCLLIHCPGIEYSRYSFLCGANI